MEANKKLQANLNRLLDIADSSFPSKKLEQITQMAKCPSCRKVYTDPDEIEFINELGECGTCDHVRGDLFWELKESEDYEN